MEENHTTTHVQGKPHPKIPPPPPRPTKLAFQHLHWIISQSILINFISFGIISHFLGQKSITHITQSRFVFAHTHMRSIWHIKKKYGPNLRLKIVPSSDQFFYFGIFLTVQTLLFFGILCRAQAPWKMSLYPNGRKAGRAGDVHTKGTAIC